LPTLLKIALGHLQHRTLGRHSNLMPLGIGYVASYAKSQLGANVDIQLYEDSNQLFHDIDSWQPHVLGLSNFMWNAELNRITFAYAKQSNPDIVCVAGGPEFPIELSECEDYLIKHREIDFYTYLEGEIAFANLLTQLIRGKELYTLKSTPQQGILSMHPKKNSLVFGAQLPRIDNMDIISSPYLTGIMDQYFNGQYSPTIQTTRGCPFTCGYCRASNSIYSKVAKFSELRVRDELRYIAKRMKKFPDIPLNIVDSNFGLFERDEMIAEEVQRTRERYGWPKVLLVDTSKDHYDRVLRIADILENKMKVVCSLQSLNSETLRIIGRKNVPMPEYRKIQTELKKRGMPSFAEMIIPLPAETKDSFIDMIQNILQAGVESIVPFTTMLLKGTKIATEDIREKYGMYSQYRLIPRQFGEYRGRKCFEIEEVCVATSTMPFEDYLICRGFGFISQIFASTQYDILRRHLDELSISIFDFVFHILLHINDNKTVFSTIYQEFIKETEEELWETPEAVYREFSKQKKYEALLKGKIGDNLLRKYRTKCLSEGFLSSIDVAFETLQKLACKKASFEQVSFWDATKQWMAATRSFADIFHNDKLILDETTISLSFDVNKWCGDEEASESLYKYKYPVTYRLFYDVLHIQNIVRQTKLCYGDDPEFSIGQVLNEYDPMEFWRKVEEV